MIVKSGQTWTGMFATRDSTGALATPSVGPAGVLYVDGTANGATVTISGSNPYKWTVTLPSLTAGQTVSMYITATIASIATASFPAEAIADTVRLSDTLTANPASGGITSSSFASGAITAASIAADAITDAKVASDVTIASVTGAVGSVTGDVGGNVVGSIGSVGSGGITSSSFASGAITAASIAADAIGASELAADAVAEIQSGLSTLTQANIRTAVGLASANLDTQFDDLAALLNSGIYSYSDTVTDGTDPLDGVQVELYSDSGLTTFITKTTTNSIGQFTVYSDTAGTHYLSLQKAGYVFPTTTVTLA